MKVYYCTKNSLELTTEDTADGYILKTLILLIEQGGVLTVDLADGRKYVFPTKNKTPFKETIP